MNFKTLNDQTKEKGMKKKRLDKFMKNKKMSLKHKLKVEFINQADAGEI